MNAVGFVALDGEVPSHVIDHVAILVIIRGVSCCAIVDIEGRPGDIHVHHPLHHDSGSNDLEEVIRRNLPVLL